MKARHKIAVLAGLCAQLCVSAAQATYTVYASQWPTAPSGDVVTKTIPFDYGGSAKLEAWRQNIDGQQIVFIRATAVAGSPQLCGVYFKAQQNGITYSTLRLRGKGQASYEGFCGYVATPTVVMVDQDPYSADFDDKAAFRIITNYMGPADFLDIPAAPSVPATSPTSATTTTSTSSSPSTPSSTSATTSTTSSNITAPSTQAISDAGKIFSWAELKYPNLFPGSATTQTYQDYVYRYYKSTGFYLAARNGRVIVHDGKQYNMFDVGAVKDFLALASTPSSSSGPLPTGNYACYSGVSWGTYLHMADIEILSATAFKTGGAGPYSYAYDTASGKITWNDSMFAGMASDFSYTKEGKPQIHILYKDKDIIYALDYYCTPQ